MRLILQRLSTRVSLPSRCLPEYATALNDIRGSSTISAEDLEAYKNGTKGINWTDLLTRTGITQDYRLAISGGNEKVKYLISGNVLDQEAITIMSDHIIRVCIVHAGFGIFQLHGRRKVSDMQPVRPTFIVFVKTGCV